MWDEGDGVIGIGYEGENVDSLVAKLLAWKIAVLVDVRLNAISRKRGFSKRSLSEALDAVGITYVHLPNLGNPKDNREGYGERHTDVGNVARATFREILTKDSAVSALDEIVRLARVQRVAVFCFEASEHHCHREQVLEAARARLEPAFA